MTSCQKNKFKKHIGTFYIIFKLFSVKKNSKIKCLHLKPDIWANICLKWASNVGILAVNVQDEVLTSRNVCGLERSELFREHRMPSGKWGSGNE